MFISQINKQIIYTTDQYEDLFWASKNSLLFFKIFSIYKTIFFLLVDLILLCEYTCFNIFPCETSKIIKFRTHRWLSNFYCTDIIHIRNNINNTKTHYSWWQTKSIVQVFHWMSCQSFSLLIDNSKNQTLHAGYVL